MPTLPFILAGPIVRRVTPRSVSVWIALAEKADVTLSIWNKVVSTGSGTGLFVPPETVLHSATRSTIRIGEKLHITVVTIDIPPQSNALLPGTLYSYNLGFSGSAGTSDLKSLGLLIDKAPTPQSPAPGLALGYSPGMLPSFVLPPVTIEKLNLVHGSCRKAHGPNKDCLAALDTIIREAVNDNDPDKRPHQLFLTGDQIYADEVPTLLMPAINDLGKQILGTKEQLAAKDKSNATVDVEATLTNFPATRRQRVVLKNAKFSTQEGANHLLSFGEFAATYLVYWNNAVWPDELFDDKDELKDKEDFLDTWDTDPLTPTEQNLAPLDEKEQKTYAGESADKKKKRIQKIKDKLQSAYKEELDEVLTFRAQLPAVRRVLANVPVYMIMDDHEVTDDWFITRDWRDKVLTSPLGVSIVRNGMMAYTLFQDWGNDPTTYASGAKAALLTQLQQMFPHNQANGPAAGAADALHTSFGFNLPPGLTPPVKWHYSVPSSETTVFVLETRTRRDYETRYSSPGLLTKSAMDDQIPLNAQPGRLTIFVSPAPVLGLGAFEELLQPGMTVFKDYDADPEAWSFSPAVFEEFLSRMEKFKKVVFLSGDVHFGITAVMDYWKKAEPKAARFVQLVSSGLKNQKFAQERFFVAGFLQKLLSSLFYPGERLGWKLRAGLQVNNPGGKNNSPSHRVRLRREPVLLPTTGWPPGAAVNQTPDWSWRLVVAADTRPDDSSPGARPDKVQIKSITPDVDPLSGDASAAYKKVLGRHQLIFNKSVARRVSWDNNIGIIKFTIDSGGRLSASQQLWYWLPGEDLNEKPDAYYVCTSSLEPSTDLPPMIPRI